MKQLSGAPLSRSADLSKSANKAGRKKATDRNIRANVLRTESKEEFSELLAGFTQDIEPTNFIERTYVQDVVCYTWDIMRYRRMKTGLLNNAFVEALTSILYRIMLPPSLQQLPGRHHVATLLAYEWSIFEETKRRVAGFLEEAGLNDSEIEAEAYKIAADDLEKIDRMANSAQAGRDRAIRAIAKYRKKFADLLERSSDRVLAADEVPGIANNAVN
jgi:hypothetical protein